MEWNGKTDVEENCQGCGWRCHAEDNCIRGRKDRQKITVGVMNARTAQRVTAGVLEYWERITA